MDGEKLLLFSAKTRKSHSLTLDRVKKWLFVFRLICGKIHHIRMVT